MLTVSTAIRSAFANCSSARCQNVTNAFASTKHASPSAKVITLIVLATGERRRFRSAIHR